MEQVEQVEQVREGQAPAPGHGLGLRPGLAMREDQPRLSREESRAGGWSVACSEAGVGAEAGRGDRGAGGR